METARREMPDILVHNLALIKRVVRDVFHRKGARGEDEGELLGDVLLKLVKNDYAVLRAFSGRSDLDLFLRTLVYRVLLDRRRSLWGKWRVSRKAQELGSAGVQLERLIGRDRLTPGEAVRALAHDPRWNVTSDTARTMLVGLPVRRRPLEVPLESRGLPPQLPAREPALPEGDLARHAARVQRALQSALRALTSEERTLLALRFRDGESVACIARRLALDQKPLYRRYEQIFRALRDALHGADVTVAEIAPLLGHGLVDGDMLTLPKPRAARHGAPNARSSTAIQFV